MKAEEREIRRKRRVLEHAVESGNVARVVNPFRSLGAWSVVRQNIVPVQDQTKPGDWD